MRNPRVFVGLIALVYFGDGRSNRAAPEFGLVGCEVGDKPPFSNSLH